MEKMKTLTLQGTTFEVVDEQARADIAALAENGGGTSVQPDLSQNDPNAPDYVKNRTHWSEEFFHYIWDGNTEEKTIITPGDAPISYVKVTNDILTAEDFIGATMTMNGVIENGFPAPPEAVLDETCVFDNGDGSVCVAWAFPVVIACDKAMSINSIEFPSAGVYVMYVPSTDSTKPSIYCSELSKTVVHKLDPKFLPDSVPYEKTIVVNEPLNITWDGNTEGLVSVQGMMYKVSDLVLTNEQIKLCTVQKGDSMPSPIAITWESMVEAGDVTEEVVNFAFSVMFVRKAGAVVQGVALPKTGIYFSKTSTEFVSSLTTTEPVEHTKTVVKKLDKKYLPDDVGGGGSNTKFIITASTEDYEHYTCDKSYSEIKAAIDEGITPVMHLGWTPLPNSDTNKPMLYELTFLAINDVDKWVSFWTNSGYPDSGYIYVSVYENECSFSTQPFLPFPNRRGAYIVGKNSFDWEITDAPIVYSPEGKKYKITVDNNGTLTAISADPVPV